MSDAPDWRLSPLRSITFDEWESGDFTQSHGYSPLGQAAWSEVEGALEWEVRALNDLDRDVPSADAYEDAASEYDGGAFGGEIGTSAIVNALLAAGFITFTSCRGHVDSPWNVPFVGFVADLPHLEALCPLARQANCGLLVREGEGLVEVFAADVLALHDLARRILHAAEEFDSLGLVPLSDG